MSEIMQVSPRPRNRFDQLTALCVSLSIVISSSLMSSCQASAEERPKATNQLELPVGVYSNETPVMCTDPSYDHYLISNFNSVETTLGGRYFLGSSSQEPEIYVTSNVCDYHDSGKNSNLAFKFENPDRTETRIPVQVAAIHIVAHEKAHDDLLNAEISSQSNYEVEYKGGDFRLDTENESGAECVAMQNMASILRAYGYDENDVRKYVAFLQTDAFQKTLPPGYTSPECHQGGAMDLGIPNSYLKS